MQTVKEIPTRLWGFVKSEPVFCVALFAALLSMLAVHPSYAYLGYIKWRTLGLLAMFMLCVAGLQKAGVLTRVAHFLLSRASSRPDGGLKAVVAVLVALPYVGGMFFTNDVSLLAFVPFAIMLLVSQDRKDLIPLVLTLQTIAANAGSYLTPFGNPHNLYAYVQFEVPFGEFIAAMAPSTIILGIFLIACIAIFVRKGKTGGLSDSSSTIPGFAATGEQAAEDVKVDRVDAIIFAALFVLSVISVLRVVPVRYAGAIVVFVVLIVDSKLFAKVDWLLLGTFVCFFIFSNNLAAIPAVNELLTGAMSGQPFWITMLTSQVISNVPSCTLLGPFTSDWRALAVGANMGGLGSPVGSLASLITLGFYRKQVGESFGSFMKTFLAFNFAALVLTCALWVVLGW